MASRAKIPITDAADSSDVRWNSLSDADLLEAWIEDRQQTALTTLIQRYSGLILSVCRRRCRCESDADDAFQTTFLYLAANARQIRKPERLVGWLVRVAQRSSVATLPSNSQETAAMVDPPAKAEEPLERLTQRHEAIVLDEELAELPEHYRSAIVLHLYEGRSVQSLAEQFGTSIGSIRGRLQRGRALLTQRLRRRGVVPAIAFASAHAWSTSSADAADAVHRLVEQLDGGPLPDPPIATSSLEPLLSKGIYTMPSLTTFSAAVGGTALVFVLLMSDGSHGQRTDAQEVTLQGHASKVASLNAPLVASAQTTNADETQPFPPNVPDADQAAKGAMPKVAEKNPVATNADPTVPESAISWEGRPVVPEPTTAIADQIRVRLAQEFNSNVTSTLQELPSQLANLAGVPVLLDPRGLQLAEIDPAATAVGYQDQKAPLQTALRMMLQPHGLKAIVQDEALVITADPSELVHRGIASNRWINVDEEAEERIATALDATVEDLMFIDTPLNEAILQVRSQIAVPIRIDDRALEEIGLSSDLPVSGSYSEMSVRSILKLTLDSADLTYTVAGESLLVTTNEAAEQRTLNRIYWLEGTGLAAADKQSVIESIQRSIEPNEWELVGGDSTIAFIPSARPALMISATYKTHESLQKYFKTLRETHVGYDPDLKPVPLPASNVPQALGGMGGMGGGGMF